MDTRVDNQIAIIPKSIEDYKKNLDGKLDPKEFYLKEHQILEYRKIKKKLKNFICSNAI